MKKCDICGKKTNYLIGYGIFGICKKCYEKIMGEKNEYNLSVL